MKKLLLFTVIAAVAICSNAQFSINKNGRIAIGDGKIEEPLNTDSAVLINPGGADIGVIQSDVKRDYPIVDDDNLVFMGSDKYTSLYVFGDSLNRGARISFGDYSGSSYPKVMVGELESANTDKLQLHGDRGIYLTYRKGMSDTIAFFDKDRGNYFQFNKEIKAPGLVVPSDSRFKTDIQDLDTISNRLSMLNAVSFKLKSESQMPLKSSDAAATSATGREDRIRYGFLAQEVNAVYPELVHTDSIGYMYVDYLGMIPLLVDAVNSLQAKTDSLSNVIDEMKSVENTVQRAKSYGSDGIDSDMLDISETVLYQNVPNPFSAETEIRCLLPDNARRADLYVYDLHGAQKKKYEVQGRGQTSVVIRGTELPAGMYIYSLIVDGKEIDSKRMILTD